MKVDFSNIHTDDVKASGLMSSINSKSQAMPKEISASQIVPLNKQAVEDLAEKIQESLNKLDINLNFSTYGENDERTAITVTEKGTGKEIRKIPSEELQHLYAKMNELTGILFNHTI